MSTLNLGFPLRRNGGVISGGEGAGRDSAVGVGHYGVASGVVGHVSGEASGRVGSVGRGRSLGAGRRTCIFT